MLLRYTHCTVHIIRDMWRHPCMCIRWKFKHREFRTLWLSVPGVICKSENTTQTTAFSSSDFTCSVRFGLFWWMFRCIEYKYSLKYQIHLRLTCVVRLCASPLFVVDTLLSDYHSLVDNQERSRGRHAFPVLREVIKSSRLLFRPPQPSTLHHYNHCAEIQLKDSLFFQRLVVGFPCFQ